MTGQNLGGWVFIIVGLIHALFADPIGRYHARRIKANARPFQKFTFFLGLVLALLGVAHRIRHFLMNTVPALFHSFCGKVCGKGALRSYKFLKILYF
jgi:hypothetical protein